MIIQTVIIILLIAVLLLEIVRISKEKVLASDELILRSLTATMATVTRFGGYAQTTFTSDGVSVTYIPEGEDESVGRDDEGAPV